MIKPIEEQTVWSFKLIKQEKKKQSVKYIWVYQHFGLAVPPSLHWGSTSAQKLKF